MGLCSLPVIYLGPNYGGDNEDNGDLSLSKGPMHPLLRSVPKTVQQATADPHLHWRFLDTRARLDQSPVGPLLLSPGLWCMQGSVCALQESVSPVLCEFWWLSVQFSSFQSLSRV